MINLLLSSPLAFVIFFPALLLAITFHEFAHAFVADKLGDPTPRIQGRVTLNPLAHLDPVGTLFILMTRFGWGKPVEYDPYNLKEPLRDSALIALAGPTANIILAAFIGGLTKFLILPEILEIAMVQFVFVNIMLAVFNLVPVHPLDGSKIILSVLPKTTALEYDAVMRHYGTLILIALLIPWINGTSPVSMLISPVIEFLALLFI